MADAEMVPATSENNRREMARRLGPLITDVRQRRLPVEQKWLNGHAAWMATRKRFFYDSPQFKHFIPIARRAIERTVVRGVQSLFPVEPPFEVFPGDELDIQAGRSAESVRVYMTYLLTKRIQMRKLATMWLRSLMLYHRAIARNTVEVVELLTPHGRWAQVWPTSRAVDPFSFYVWPETAVDFSQALLVFEDMMLPWQEYDRQAQEGVAQRIQPDELTTPEWPLHITERLSDQSMTDPSTTRDGGRTRDGVPVGRFVSMTELYLRAQSVWFKGWLVWNVQDGPRLTRFHPAKYPEPPYRMALARPLPNEHYTSGMMDDLEPLQVLFNDQVNQSEEARVIASNPPVILDAADIGRTDSYVYGPRKKWFVTDPSKPPTTLSLPDTSLASVRAAQMTLALVNSLGGSNPSTEGQPTRGLPRAGGAVLSLLSLAMADTKELSMIVENELLTPTLADLHRLTLQFVPRSQLIKIPGTHAYPPQTISVDDLYGDWQLRWVGPQHAEEIRGRAQAIAQLAAGLAKIAPILQQQGWAVNWAALVKRAWRDTVGERGVEDIITPIQQAPALDPAMLPQLVTMLQQAGPGGPLS